jgi:hypothetical protein
MQREVQDNINYTRLRNYAIGAVINSFPEVEEADVKKYFAYLEKYCEIINVGLIPIATWKSMGPCSAVSIRNKLIDFFDEHSDHYKEMAQDEVMKAILGEEEWTKFWNEYEYDDENADENYKWRKAKPTEEPVLREVESDGEESPWRATKLEQESAWRETGRDSMEDVDGGSRKKTKSKSKQKSKRKNKNKTNKNKINRRAKAGRKKSYKARK